MTTKNGAPRRPLKFDTVWISSCVKHFGHSIKHPEVVPELVEVAKSLVACQDEYKALIRPTQETINYAKDVLRRLNE